MEGFKGQILPEARKRIEEIRARAKERVGGMGGMGGMRSGGLSPQQVLGAGKILETGRRQIETITARLKERRPGLLPTVTETIKKWEPGRRVREVIPTTEGEGAIPPRETQTTPSGGLSLRA
ncbi:unnamed protein product [marine sediment metagenome]|uniref:Uncharacterized protein n=1 Tax=marine sediment metagenome TaxID=412755 RepID=X1K0N9_9ZZZZ